MENAWWIAGGVAGISAIAAFWSNIKHLYHQTISRLIVKMEVCGYAAEAVQLYLNEKSLPSRFGPRRYLGWLAFFRPRRRSQIIPVETLSNHGKLYWFGWKPVWLDQLEHAQRETNEGETARDWRNRDVTLTFARWMFDQDRLILDAINHYNEQIVSREQTGGKRHFIQHVFGTAGRQEVSLISRGKTVDEEIGSNNVFGFRHKRLVGFEFSDLGPLIIEDSSAVERLALSDQAERLVRDAHQWKNGEEWYKGRGIPWRRGWLLHGQPGSGKSALSRAIAEDLDLPVFVYDLASLFNEELQKSWSQMLAQVPCMALIEDIDNVFDGRKNVVGRDQHLTFDCLLNCIDGIERSDGLLLIVTTNRLDRLDTALGIPQNGTSTRPGRIDQAVELGLVDEPGRRKLAKRILHDCPQFIEQVVREGSGDTGAQYQERCTQVALGWYWNANREDRVGDRIAERPVPHEVDRPTGQHSPLGV